MEEKEGNVWVLCVDPQTAIFYTVNITTRKLRIIQKDSVPQFLAMKAAQEIDILRNLINFKNFRWREGIAVQSYRRRDIPEYLLKRPKYVMPCYVAQSRLPKALNESERLQIRVLFDDYQKVNVDTLTLQIYIVTAVNETLKIIFREVYENCKVYLHPKEKYQFCLRRSGYQEYLYGQYPLINFQCVRDSLQKKQYLELQLAEQQKEQISKLRFPPLFRLSKDDQKINLLNFQEHEILLWYPPFPFTNQNLALLDKIQKLKEGVLEPEDIKKEGSKKPLDTKLYSTVKQFELAKIKRQFKVGPRSKEQSLKQLQMRTFDVTQKIIFTKRNLIYSGQCQFDFSFTVQGIDNLYSIFQIAEQYLPKDYLQNPPYLNSCRFEAGAKKQTPFRIYKKDTGTQVAKTFSTSGPYGYKSSRAVHNFWFTPHSFCIKTMLFHGTKKIEEWRSCRSPICSNPRLSQIVKFKKLSSLTLEARLAFEIQMISNSGQTAIAASGVLKIFDFNNHLLQGRHSCTLWPFIRIDPRISTGTQNFSAQTSHPYSKLFVKFRQHSTTVEWSLRSQEIVHKLQWIREPKKKKQIQKTSQFINQLQKLIKMDPLRCKSLSPQQKSLLTAFRDDYKGQSNKFGTFLDGINWEDPNEVIWVQEARQYWNKLAPTSALSILDAFYADESVRAFACQCINHFSDDELSFYMPQIVQAITFQSHHYNILIELMLDRAIQNPFMVGYSLFWEIRGQLHFKYNFQRLALVLQQFVMLCGSFRKQLLKTVESSRVLQKMSQLAKTNFEESLRYLIECLPPSFKLPIDNRVVFKQVIKQKCELKDSKKKPVSLGLRHQQFSIQSRYLVKFGDDLRQDELIIQLMRFMNRVWMDVGISTQMIFYRVRNINNNVGIIEAVNAQTLNKIQTKYGALGPLKNNIYQQYLKENNPDEADYKYAQKNFMRSLAGSIIATYVLGVADRHPSNVMLSAKGHLIHIDFGNILGKFKEKFSVKRQISPFLFTEDLAHVLGGRKSALYEEFSQLCGFLYILIRRKSDQLINLMLMMQSAGLPQLTKMSDLDYCVQMLSLNLSQMQARKKISDQLIDSLNNQTRRRIDNLAHSFRRG